MKIINKIASAALGLLFIGSSVFAQSLDDAKKAIDAEQYQKAESMLKNLTVTQASKDENFFYLGWVYLKQDYPDSAKTVFTKGIAIEPKSALNYVGLGAVARLNNDNASATANFNKAIDLTGRKDSKPFVYIGRAYLLPTTPGGKISAADANAAIAVLQKGRVKNDKDVEILIAIGDAYRSQINSNDAYRAYQDAQAIDPKNPAINVALGVLWQYADNFTLSEKAFQEALAIDPNYGPAYREWAETDNRWAGTEPKMADAKIKQAVEEYKKYLSLTDYSPESQMRYADFLITAGQFGELQKVASDLAKSPNPNVRIYRYLGYAGYENKDYPAGLTAINTWLAKGDPKKIIPRDYLYLGRLQIASGQDSLGIMSLQKAVNLDSTFTEAYADMAKSFSASKKYSEAGDAYAMVIAKGGRNVQLTDYFYEGRSYFNAYQNQLFNPKDGVKPDTTLLIKADSAFSYINQKVPTFADAYIYRAYVNDYKETDRNNLQGLAKPFFEKYIDVVVTKGDTPAAATKTYLTDSYVYLGRYYALKEKDAAKATEYYTKALQIDPTNQEAQQYLKPAAGKSKGK